MTWHPPLSPDAITILVAIGLVLIAASLWWARRQLPARGGAGLATLALRGLALALLLFFVLQPARLPPAQKITAQRTLAVVIDTSASMSLPASAEASAAATRLEEVHHLLERSGLLERAGAPAAVALYGFDSHATALRPEALGQLAAAGRATDLGAALEFAARQHQHDDLAGVLIFTDGRDTSGGDPREAARRLKAPLFPVPVGAAPRAADAPERTRDLAIEAVSADPRVIVGRPAQVAVSVSAAGYDARQVAVELRQDDRVIATTAVAVSPQQPRRQALFTVRPDAVGTQVYEVRVPLEEGERRADNNAASFSIEVVDPVNRLVYLDRLRDERRFLRPLLDGRRNVRYTAVVQQDATRLRVDGNDPAMRQEAANLSPEQLLGTKAVILGDLPAAALTQEQIAQLKAWVDKGGALLLLAGPASLAEAGLANTPRAELLPVSLEAASQYLESEFRVELTPHGAAHPAFQRVRARWGAAPPLLSRFAVGAVEPAATVLMATADGAAAPVVVSQSYGHGKVAVVLTDSTWRWQLGFDPAAPFAAAAGGESPHAVFWGQMIDWLLPDLGQEDPAASQVQLIADRSEYEVNDTVVLLAGVRGADGGAVSDAEVEFTIASPDGRPIHREGQFEPDGGEGAERGGTYVASFPAYHAGQYDIRVSARRGGEALGGDSLQVRVVQPVLEFVDPEPDAALLAELARLSGGQVLGRAELERIVEIARLQPREVLLQPSGPRDARSAWDRWWLLAAFVGLMAGEWFIRRRNQWV